MYITVNNIIGLFEIMTWIDLNLKHSFKRGKVKNVNTVNVNESSPINETG